MNSNLPLNAEASKEKFVYPANAAIKDAYIGLLGMMKLQKKIRFYIHECVLSILEQNGWVTDYNPGDPKFKPDKNYKKGLRYLKVLETPYFKFIGPGRIELCVYDAATKRRITNFDQFFKLCADDPHMSEYTSCDEEVIFEEWNDVICCSDVHEDEIAAEICMMDSAVPLKEDVLKSTFELNFDKQEYFDQFSAELTSSDDIGV
ncbi:hypothetical protein [Methanolobus halotolerans]|uniref:Uncharacterized protein n=1 Tax=Methanolobus halotolerans TaxID=2052935 RepID=A0A4E0Q7V9_9EURY|nr:hypothetical protein [Methanolobus halotolerans]TGC07410.1 hypothetical protein CUN85_11435 [Methanolobus halotolerans]